MSRLLPQVSISEIPLLQSVESRRSWLVATAVVFIMACSYGAPLVATVALKEISADLGSSRSLPALAISLVWLGSGAGAIGFGWIAERISYKATTIFGALAIGAGLMLSMAGGSFFLIAGHVLLIGLVGSGAINIPLMVYISRWFDQHRGSALALVASGQYVAGAIWPSLITFGVEWIGWRRTMFWFGVATAAAIVIIAFVALVPPRGVMVFPRKRAPRKDLRRLLGSLDRQPSSFCLLRGSCVARLWPCHRHISSHCVAISA